MGVVTGTSSIVSVGCCQGANKQQHNGHYFLHYWHERCHCSRSLLGGRRATIATISINSPSPQCFFLFTHIVPQRRNAQIKIKKPQKSRVDPSPHPVGDFGAPWYSLWIWQVVHVAGGVVLLEVRCCRQCNVTSCTVFQAISK